MLFLFAMFMPLGIQTADASQYYYFESPKADASYTVGQKVPVKFYAGVVIKRTNFDAWGNPSTVTYEDMPVSFRVMKGNTEVYSKEFTYQEGTWIETSYKPQVTGTLKLQIYGRNMGLNVTDMTLQDTMTIKVKKKKASAVKKIKPKITVVRTSKKTAEITCTNSNGYGMKVYRATKKKGKFKRVKTTSKSTYTNKKLSSKKAYYYKVRLYAKKGKKTYLSKWSSKVKCGKFKPGIKLSYSSSKGVKVSWKKISGAEYYEIGRNTVGEKGDYEIVGCAGKSDTTFYDKNIEKGKTYYYCVIGDKDGSSKPIGKYMGNAYKIKTS